MGNFFEKLLQSGTLLPRQWRTNEKATANQQKIQNRRDGHCLELHCRLLCCGTTLLLSSVASLQHAGFLEKLFGRFQKANKQKQFYLSCFLEEIIRRQDCVNWNGICIEKNSANHKSKTFFLNASRMVAKVTIIIVIYYSPQIQICHTGSSLLLIQMLINLLTKESKTRKTRCCKNISAVLGSQIEPFDFNSTTQDTKCEAL